MKKRLFFVLACTVLLGVGLWFSKMRDSGLDVSAQARRQGQINKAELNRKVAKLHIPFIANQGQTDKEVKFYAHTFGGTVFITNGGDIVYSLPKFVEKKAPKEGEDFDHSAEPLSRAQAKKRSPRTPQFVRVMTLKEEIIDGEVTDVKGEAEALTEVSYFKGSDPLRWKSNIHTYDIVNLGEVYRGVELRLKAYGNNVEKLFYVKPGVEPTKIKMRMSGGKLGVNKNGELEIKTELGDVRFTKPLAYQENGAKRVFVDVEYVVRGDEYSFRVGEYDRANVLIIDPLLASTFLGGGGSDIASSIAIGSNGDVYVAGSTSSSDFPVTPGAFDTDFNGVLDVFISRLDGDLEGLLASTFLGGSGSDVASFITIDSNGDVYIAGITPSSDFPVTPDAFDPLCGTDGTCNGGLNDAFVSKLDGDLTMLLASTFLGGSGGGDEGAASVAVGPDGSVYVAGGMASLDFPVTPGALDTDFNGVFDAFISKLDGNLEDLLASTFLGGSGFDDAFSMTIDSNGNVFVAGPTGSSDFPTTPDALDTDCGTDGTCNGGGLNDAFVSKLDGNLEDLLASTFLGGSGGDAATFIATGSGGDVYVAGLTASLDFPRTTGALDTDCGTDGTCNGNFDAFISRLDGDLTMLLASTFLGGSGGDIAFSIAIDSNGDVHAAGGTVSSDFPTTPDTFDTSFNGSDDAFISRLDGDLTALLASTFLGGGGSENAFPIAIGSGGDVYVAGFTSSSDFPVTPGVLDASLDVVDAFVSQLNLDSDDGNGGCSIARGGIKTDQAAANVLISLVPVFAIGFRVLRRKRNTQR